MEGVPSALVAVLAGGAGRRMAGAKPTAPLAGRSLIAHPLAAAAAAGIEAVVIAKRSSPLPPLQCPVVFEPEQPVHPLYGITAALRHGDGRPVVIIACDMPFVTPQLLAWLAALEGAAVARVQGRPQPLMGRYLHAQLPALERALHRALPLTAAVLALGPRLLDERELSRFGDPRTLCFNVNDRRELAEAERRVVAHAG